MLNKHYNGHMYRGSATETDSDCGNCDGARCDTCKEYWTVDGNGDERFYTIEEAQKVADTVATLLPSEYRTPSEDYFFEKDGLLYAGDVYALASNNYGCIDVQCNQESSMYNEKLEDCKKRRVMYNECKCLDKDNENLELSCPKYGCNDVSCYAKMKNGCTNKKWYM